MAWTSRTRKFALREAEIYSALGAFNWWDEIDKSEEWQNRIYYALCVSYAVVSLVALVPSFLLLSGKIVVSFLAFTIYLNLVSELGMYHFIYIYIDDSLRMFAFVYILCCHVGCISLSVRNDKCCVHKWRH